MIYLAKTQPGPDVLKKLTGKYGHEDVLKLLKSDFKEKCYICEASKLTSINVEHFVSHNRDKVLKYSWDNLFWSCAHCNGLKSDKYNNLLNCTDENSNIENRLEYYIYPLEHSKIEIKALDGDPSTLQTKELIETVFNGTTKIRKIESDNLRSLLIDDLRDFINYLSKYSDKKYAAEDKEIYLMEIKAHLSPYAQFISFKKWIVRNNEFYMGQFGNLL